MGQIKCDHCGNTTKELKIHKKTYGGELYETIYFCFDCHIKLDSAKKELLELIDRFVNPEKLLKIIGYSLGIAE